jgi:CRISPR-associated protein Cmr1
MNFREWKLKALTDIWTGDACQKNLRLIPTGFMGSIRWWFETLVRGLGGNACDPTSEGNRCPDSRWQPTEPGHHCAVCEFFGCTGWTRKFRLMVLDEENRVIQKQIQRGQPFTMRFIPLRPIREEEWCLLDLTLRLIADYGAMGGKTVYKPSDEQSRQKEPHHQDYGIIEIGHCPSVMPSFNRKQLEAYVHDQRWREIKPNDFAWVSLKHFWCVKGRYLARQNDNTSTFNRVIGRPEPKNRSSQYDSWLAGRRAGGRAGLQEPVSKKVFSFRQPPRTFGFVQQKSEIDSMFTTLSRCLSSEWKNFSEREIMKADNILEQLLKPRTQ